MAYPFQPPQPQQHELVTYALDRAQRILGPTQASLDFVKLQRAAEHNDRHKLAMHLFSAYEGMNPFTNQMFLTTVRAYGGRLFDYHFPIVHKDQFPLYETLLVQQGNRMISGSWDFRPQPLPAKGFRTPGTQLSPTPHSREHHITNHGAVFEVPIDIFLDPSKEMIFRGNMRTMVVSITKTMQSMMERALYENIKNDTYQREFGPQQKGGSLPFSLQALRRELKKQSDTRFVLNKGGAGRSFIEASGVAALQSRNVKIEDGKALLLLPGGTQGLLELDGSVEKSYAQGGPLKQYKNVERGRRMFTPTHGLEIIEVFPFTCDDTGFRDPTEGRTVVSQFFTALPHISLRDGNYDTYKSNNRVIQIMNGNTGELVTFSLNDIIEGAVLHSKSGDLTTYGVDVFNSILGGSAFERKNIPAGFSPIIDPNTPVSSQVYIDTINLRALARNGDVEEVIAKQISQLSRSRFNQLSSLSHKVEEDVDDSDDMRTHALLEAHAPQRPELHPIFKGKWEADLYKILAPLYVQAVSSDVKYIVKNGTLQTSSKQRLPLPTGDELVVITEIDGNREDPDKTYEAYIRMLVAVIRELEKGAHGNAVKNIIQGWDGKSKTEIHKARAAQLYEYLNGSKPTWGDVTSLTANPLKDVSGGGVKIGSDLQNILMAQGFPNTVKLGDEKSAKYLNAIAKAYTIALMKDEGLSPKRKYAIRKFIVKAMSDPVVVLSIFDDITVSLKPGALLARIENTVDDWMSKSELRQFRTSFGTGRDRFISGDEGEFGPGRALFSIAQCLNLMEHLPLTRQVLRFLTQNNIVVPLGFIIFRPWVNITTGSAVVVKSGAETAVQVITKSGTYHGQNVQSKGMEVFVDFNTASCIAQPRNGQFIPEVIARRNLGGAGVDFIGTGHQAGAFHAQSGDMLVAVTGYKWKNKESFLDMTGRVHPDILAQNGRSELQWESAAVFANRWRIKHTEIHAFSPPTFNYDDSVPERVGHTLCLKGHQYEWSLTGNMVSVGGSDAICNVDGCTPASAYKALDSVGSAGGRGMEMGAAHGSGRVF